MTKVWVCMYHTDVADEVIAVCATPDLAQQELWKRIKDIYWEEDLKQIAADNGYTLEEYEKHFLECADFNEDFEEISVDWYELKTN